MSERKKSGEGESFFDVSVERVHGRHEIATVRSKDLVTLSQVRPTRNAEHLALKESIRTIGLINQIDTVRLSEAELREYIDFTNSLWGSENRFEDFEHQRQPDGTFFLVSSGHSRLAAIQSLEEDGYPEYQMDVKVHTDRTIEGFLQRQIDENIHSKPPLERRAMAIAEYYYWGIEKQRWTTQKEFMSANSSMSKNVLSEALAFANLPDSIRSFVMDRKLSFAGAISLGKAAPVFEEHIYFMAHLTPRDATEKQRERIQARLERRLHIEANRLVAARLNSTASEKRMKSIKDVLLREMQDARRLAEQDDGALIQLEELNVYTPEELLEQLEKKEKAELAAVLGSIARTPGEWTRQVLALNSRFVPADLIEDAIEDFQHSSEKAVKVLGSRSLEEMVSLLPHS